MATSPQEDPKKNSKPQLVKLDYAFKLAEQWVGNMSKSLVNDKSPSVELEGRPLRLGIGAAVPKESKFTRSSNPIERKLLAKLHNEKRKVAINEHEGLAPTAENRNDDEDNEEEGSESKTRAFTKKRPPTSISSLRAKKKHR